MPSEIHAPPLSSPTAHWNDGRGTFIGGEARDPALWRAARSFEAVFIAEMMSHAGVAKGCGRESGGFAEQTFRSLLSREWAEDLADRGGVGLADQIYRSVANAKPR